jgi:hypothetical protein
MAPAHVTLPEIQVMYIESTTGFAGGAKAFDALEAPFPTLKGRRFCGTFQPPAGPLSRLRRDRTERRCGDARLPDLDNPWR